MGVRRRLFLLAGLSNPEVLRNEPQAGCEVDPAKPAEMLKRLDTEMALAIIDNNSKLLQYAGAYNPLYLIRAKKHLNGDHLRQYASIGNKDYQLFELKGDKQPIAIYSIETDFDTKQIQLQEGDSIYLFSDGFVDQKGGPNNRKFLSKNFRKSLLEIQPNTMKEQHKILNDTLEEWRKGFEQIDDILVMGFRIWTIVIGK